MTSKFCSEDEILMNFRRIIRESRGRLLLYSG